MMKILTGTGHPELAELIAASAGVDLCATDITRFPDGEIFVKIVDNVRGDDIFIVPVSYTHLTLPTNSRV